jgi:hypothetical protein
MGSRSFRTLAVTASLVVLIGGVALRAAASPVAAPNHTIDVATLITGDRVELGTSSSGTPTAAVIRAANEGPGAQVQLVTLHGHVYAIPASAMAYVGRYLDPSLFDATAIAAAGFGERIPLRITFTGSVPTLPGVTITSSSAGRARAYVTRESAKTFGAALADQAVSDSLAGWPSKDALFGSIVSIAPVLPGSPTTSPQFPQTTVVIKGYEKNGAPMRLAFGLLFNMDDGRKFGGFTILFNGEARASVPLGTYAGIFDDISFSADGSFTVREIEVADFAVTGTQGPMIIDAGTSTARPSITTPEASVPYELDTDVTFIDARNRSSFGSGWLMGLPGSAILYAPLAPPSVGSVRSSMHWLTADPSSAAGSYTFDATAVWPGVPADLATTLAPVSQALAIDEAFYADQGLQIGGAARFIFPPKSFFAFAVFAPIPMPLERLDYVYAPTGSYYEDLALANQSAWDPGFVDGQFLRWRTGHASDRWFRNPYTLSVPYQDPNARAFACWACATDTKMLFINSENDGDPTHEAWVFGGPGRSPVAWFNVYRDGVRILHKPDRLGAAFKIPSGPARYRVVNKLSRRYTGTQLSTEVVSDVTFDSAAGVPNPKNVYCIALARTCQVMPVLTASLDINATLRGTIPVGSAAFDLQAGHMLPANDPAITSVSVAVRRSSTNVWHPLTVTAQPGGGYRAAFKAMTWMENRQWDVQVRVTDAAGGRLIQTTSRAFLVAP